MTLGCMQQVDYVSSRYPERGFLDAESAEGERERWIEGEREKIDRRTRDGREIRCQSEDGESRR